MHLSDDEYQKGDDRNYRKELWIGVAIAYANSGNSRYIDGMERWANEALAAYDRKFGKDDQ